jgi:hypothetical protein
LTPLHPKVKFTVMENLDFDQLLKSYREAVDHWVDAIHAEEALPHGRPLHGGDGALG